MNNIIQGDQLVYQSSVFLYFSKMLEEYNIEYHKIIYTKLLELIAVLYTKFK